MTVDLTIDQLSTLYSQNMIELKSGQDAFQNKVCPTTTTTLLPTLPLLLLLILILILLLLLLLLLLQALVLVHPRHIQVSFLPWVTATNHQQSPSSL